MRRVEACSRIIAFSRAYVDLTGSITSALMLSQAVYWQLRREGSPEGEWWYMQHHEWTNQVGLSRKEQQTARAHLREHGWWQEEERGMPSKLFYRVDLSGLEEALANMLGEREQQGGRKGATGWAKGANKPIRTARAISEITSEITSEKRSRLAADDDQAGKVESTGTAVPPPVAASGSSPGSAAPKAESLAPAIGEACGDWQERYDGTAPGARIGRALKPVLARVAKRLGCGLVEAWRREARAAWGAYLDSSTAQFASAERFAQTYGSWAGTEHRGSRVAAKASEPKRDYGPNTAAAALAEIHAARPDLKAEHEAWVAKARARHEAEKVAR